MKIGFAVLALGLLALAHTSPAQAETTSLTALIGLGQSQECTYQKVDDDGTQSSGTIYLADQKMRADLMTTSPDGTYPMSMLREGDWQYMWGEAFGPGQGMKINASQAASGRGPQGQQGLDADEPIDYQCRPWAADSSKFVVPSDVQFMELGGMIPGMGATGGMDMRSIQCGACAQVPEEERANCLQMMGC